MVSRTESSRKFKAMTPFFDLVEKIEHWPEVTKVTLGRNEDKKSASSQQRNGKVAVRCRVLVDGPTGWQCSAQCGTKVQIFFVSYKEKKGQAVHDKLNRLPEFASS